MSTKSQINKLRNAIQQLNFINNYRLPARLVKRIRCEESTWAVLEEYCNPEPDRKHNPTKVTTLVNKHGECPHVTAHMEGCSYGFYLYGQHNNNKWTCIVYQGGIQDHLFTSPEFKLKKDLVNWMSNDALTHITAHGTAL